MLADDSFMDTSALINASDYGRVNAVNSLCELYMRLATASPIRPAVVKTTQNTSARRKPQIEELGIRGSFLQQYTRNPMAIARQNLARTQIPGDKHDQGVHFVMAEVLSNPPPKYFRSHPDMSTPEMGSRVWTVPRPESPPETLAKSGLFTLHKDDRYGLKSDFKLSKRISSQDQQAHAIADTITERPSRKGHVSRLHSRGHPEKYRKPPDLNSRITTLGRRSSNADDAMHLKLNENLWDDHHNFKDDGTVASFPGHILPSSENNYGGFCESAWKFQAGECDGIKVCKVMGSSKSTIHVWKCVNINCAFQTKMFGDLKHPTFDQRVYESSLRIRFRWSFLVKSHVAQSKVADGSYSYKCILCISSHDTMPVFGGIDTLLMHLEIHRDEHVPALLLHSAGYIMDRFAPDEEDFDLNILPSKSSILKVETPRSSIPNVPSTRKAPVLSPETRELTSEGDDDSSSLNSDAYSDIDPEPRMLDPKAHFRTLQELHEQICNGSALAAYDYSRRPVNGILPRSAADTMDQSSVPKQNQDLNGFVFINLEANTWCSSFTSDKTIFHIYQDWQPATDRFARIKSVHMSRNILSKVCRNLLALQEAGFCNDKFSLLSRDPDRASVVNLSSIIISDVVHLATSLENILRRMLEGDHLAEDFSDLAASCRRLWTSSSPFYTDTNDVVGYSYDTVRIVDLAVLSYSGTHYQSILPSVAYSGVSSLDHRGKNIDQYTRSMQDHLILETVQLAPISLRRMKMQCLDSFLGCKEVWVFSLGSEQPSNERFFLSTLVEDFADVWGPMWKSLRNSQPNQILEYNIGNGAILPWRPPTQGLCKPDEVFCHWISARNWDSNAIEIEQLALAGRYFVGDERLLIGADTSCGLRVNQNCIQSQESLAAAKTELYQKGALQVPRTWKGKRFKDSHSVLIQGSAMGMVSVGNTITYKRRTGQNMKDTLVERWRMGLRNPVGLEAFSGVELSLCTQNARRRRLLHILNSLTIRKYLKTISYAWPDKECELGYFEALNSPKLFRRFWKTHKDWHIVVGDAISTSLDALQCTGIDAENKELSALWVESFDEEGDSDGEETPPAMSALTNDVTESMMCKFEASEEWIVTVFRSEHTWTGFLQDSPECLTMAVMDSVCLDIDDAAQYARRCQSLRPNDKGSFDKWSKGYPVLQTAVLLNKALLKSEGLCIERTKEHRERWNAENLKRNCRFHLGDHGNLRTLSSATKRTPAFMEWEPIISEKWQELKNINVNQDLLGKNHERHHQEYIRGVWEVDALPVLLLSKSSKTRLREDR